MAKELLFAGGNPRSGTSVLGRLLNAHPDFLIGIERYHRLLSNKRLKPEHFEEERFGTFEANDTHDGVAGQFDDFAWFRDKYRAARVIGDKYPPLPDRFGYLNRTFPSARYLIIVRNPISVAESYEMRARKPGPWSVGATEAVEQWNRNTKLALEAAQKGDLDIKFVEYEALFSGPEALNALYRELGADPSIADHELIASEYAKAAEIVSRAVRRDDEMRKHVALHGDFETYAALLDRCLPLRSEEAV